MPCNKVKMVEVKKENDQNNFNSLLRTAANTKLGASKSALAAFRSGIPPPVKKDGLPASDKLHISENTGPGHEEVKPAMVRKIVKVTEDVEILDSPKEETPKEVEVPKEKEAATTTTNKVFNGPNVKSKMSRPLIGGKALKITAQPKNVPSPYVSMKNAEKRSMEIQKGIHFSAPSPLSLDRIQVQLGQEHVLPVSKEVKEQQERAKRDEDRELKEAQYQKAKEEVKRQLRNEVDRVFGTPTHVAEARFMARKAMQAAKENAARKFPVSEVIGQKHDDDVSTIGNPHFFRHVLCQPVSNTNALIDQVESAAEDGTVGGLNAPIDCTGGTMGAMCMGTIGKLSGTTDGQKKQGANAMFSDKGLQLRLSQMNISAEALQSCSPRSNVSMPDLEGDKEELIDLTNAGGKQEEESLKKLSTQKIRKVTAKVDTTDDDRYAVEDEESPKKVRKQKTNPPQSREGASKAKRNDAHRHNDYDDDDDSSVASSLEEDFPSPGMICGAVPLYLLYSTKTAEAKAAATQLVSRIAAIKNTDYDHQQEITEKEESDEIDKSELNDKRSRVLLDNDDIYWDTLSTIASTRGLDYEKFAPAMNATSPGPIPIEIRMNSEKNKEDVNEVALSYSQDDDKHGESKLGNKALLPVAAAKSTDKKARKNKKKTTKKSKKSPKAPKEESKVVEKKSEVLIDLTSAESDNEEMPLVSDAQPSDPIQKKSEERSVKWGFEEIYEATDSSTPIALEHQEEQELLSRTLQLSKDLLASLAEQGLDEDGDDAAGLLSFRTESEADSPIVPMSSLGETSYHAPIKPEIMSKLDVLRAQRAQAMARFQSSRGPEMHVKTSFPEKRERNHLQFYAAKQTRNIPDLATEQNVPEMDGRDDMESFSATSGNSSAATPTKKAQELRRQLDEALIASREIRKSQEKLGVDLKTFKSKFYQKSGELEEQANQAMGN